MVPESPTILARTTDLRAASPIRSTVLAIALGLALAAPTALVAQAEPDAPEEAPSEAAAPESEPSAADAWLEGDDDAVDAWLEGDDEEDDVKTPTVDLSEVNAFIRDAAYDDALTALAALAEQAPEDPFVPLLIGEVSIAAGRPAEAIEPLRAAIALDTGLPRTHFQLGSAFAALGRDEEALAAFGEELTRNEDAEMLAAARFNRAMLFQKASNPDGAAGELEAVLQFQPTRAEVYGDLASLYIEAGSLDRALAALERGDRFGFRSAPHHYSIGARYYRAGDTDRAIDQFLRTIELDPTHAEACRSVGAALDRAGRSDEAVPHLRRYLELRPNARDGEQVRAMIAEYGG